VLFIIDMPYGAFLGILFFKNGYTVSKFTPWTFTRKYLVRDLKLLMILCHLKRLICNHNHYHWHRIWKFLGGGLVTNTLKQCFEYCPMPTLNGSHLHLKTWIRIYQSSWRYQLPHWSRIWEILILGDCLVAESARK